MEKEIEIGNHIKVEQGGFKFEGIVERIDDGDCILVRPYGCQSCVVVLEEDVVETF